MNISNVFKTPLWLILFSILFILTPGSRLVILMITWIWIMYYCFQNLEKRVILMAMMSTIYIFLLTRLTIPLFCSNSYISEMLDGTMVFRPDTYNTMIVAIFLCIIFIFLGYYITSKNENRRINSSFGNNIPSLQILKIREISLKLYYLTVSFFAFEVIEKVIFVLRNGYLEFYLSYTKMLPTIVYKLSSVYELVFYFFLATLPSKKTAKKPILIYLLIQMISLFAGARNEFVLAFLFIVIYYYVRNALTPHDPWLTKKGKIYIALSIPVLCALMFIVLLIRGGDNTNEFGFWSMVVNLLFQQGTSMQVLGLTFENASNLDANRLFSIGPLIDTLNDNVLFHLVGIGKHYDGNTLEAALYGHNYGNYITYTFEERRYLAGGGMGSSFIAEVWLDWGYIGLALWSLMYGCILAKVYDWMKRNVWMAAISFFIMMQIIYSPRSCAIYFVSQLISPIYLITFFIIWQYSKRRS